MSSSSSALALAGEDVLVRTTLPFVQDESVFRCTFHAEPAEQGEEVVLEFGGLAALSEVWLNGRKILESNSTFEPHRVDVSAIVRSRNELEIAGRSLTAAIKAKRGQAPHARWRTRIVSEPQVRWFRTTLLGPAPVGPWRPVNLVRHRRVVIDRWTRGAEIDETSGTGIIHASLQIRTLDAPPVKGWLRSGEYRAPITFDEHGAFATLSIPHVRRWWPHTHGVPELYPLQADLEFADGSQATFDDIPIGFRSIDFNSGVSVNGVAVFCRGVVWTPTDESSQRRRLTLLRDAGFNMIRIAGTTLYESESFHRLCDELGLLVWQDMMFANMDYPFADAAFHRTVMAEAERELSRLSKHSSTAVICGNSEIEQQAGMLGLDPMLGRGDFFGKELPTLVAQLCPGVPYIPSAPSGGDQPFRTRTGVANYFGVGAYLRPLDDVRRAGVRFASECLAFSNVPEPENLAPGITPGHPLWKQGIPRDAGASWDFEDVRDHYLKLLYSVDPVTLRYTDIQRYLELSRVVSGEVMAEVFGEWRRPESPCGGGIILRSADPEPGAGWGILDSDGYPKAAYWFLKRALAPQALWMTDEGLNGVDIHVANDRTETLNARLRIALYDRSRKVDEAERAIAISERGRETFGVEEILGRFVDASHAYRFGPPAHDLIVASLYANESDEPTAQAARFPAGRSVHRVPITDLGIDMQAQPMADASLVLTLRSQRFASGVRITAANALPDDSYFNLEPSVPHQVSLQGLADKCVHHGNQRGRPSADCDGEAVMSTRHRWFRSGIYSVLGHVDLPEDKSGDTGVVIVPPFGWEDVCSYRPLRFMAQGFAQRGIATLRYDLPGTGDSSGDAADAALLDSWIRSVTDAVSELRSVAGVRDVSVVGVHLGAMLAMKAVSQGADIRQMVLWGPSATGRRVLRELRAAANVERWEHLADEDAPPQPMPGFEAGGFLISPETQRALEDLDVSSLPWRNSPRVLLLSRDDLPPDGRILEALHTSLRHVAIAPGRGYAAMMASPQESVSCVETIDLVASFITADIPGLEAPAVETPETPHTRRTVTDIPPGARGATNAGIGLSH